MQQNQGSRIGILGLGVCVPDRVLSNADLEKMVDTSDDWIVSRTGIHERRILSPEEVPSGIATRAAERAIADAGIDRGKIDAVIYATYTPDHYMPASACLVQRNLALNPCIAFDLNGACTGFVYALQVAYGLMLSGQCRHPLVVGCDCASRILDYTDRNTCVLFGDAAGAVVLGEVPGDRGILSNYAGADGAGAFLICQPIGAAAKPLTEHNVKEPGRYMQMNGREVFKFAVRVVHEALEEAVKRAGLTVEDIDLLVLHQANVRIIQSAMEKFGFHPERVIINMDKYGNTSAASIPLALDTARQQGKLKQGTSCALVAFGAGLTYGATVLRW